MNNKLLKIDIGTLRQTCFGCPTTFEFEDYEENSYFFRLRHGWWRLDNETKRTTMLEGDAESINADGVCSWEEAKVLLALAGLVIYED